MSLPPSIQKIRQRIWEGSLPLEIVLSPTECRIFDKSDPYLVHFPRLSYLPFLLERLHNFFTPFLIDPSASEPHKGWFSFEDVPLKWHCPVGLLYDLFSGAEPVMLHRDDKGGGYGSVHESQLRPVKEEEEGNDGEGEEGGGVGAEEGGTKLPWKLTVHFSDWPEDQLVRLDTDWKALHDAFVNSAKEADFVRNGTARGIMSLSAEESKKLWRSVVEHDLSTYTRISFPLFSPSTPLRNIPLRIYLPQSASPSSSSPPPSSPSSSSKPGPTSPPSSSTPSLRTIQAPITPSQTLGTALHTLLPSLFPSRRTAVHARPVLHGAEVPLGARVDELMRAMGYCDGWVGLGVVMVG